MEQTVSSRGPIPTTEEINALPDPVRRYIHDLETRCDPSGDVRTIHALQEHINALESRDVAEQKALDAAIAWDEAEPESQAETEAENALHHALADLRIARVRDRRTSVAVADTPQPDSRAAFEAWASARGLEMDREDDGYQFGEVALAWEAWQQARREPHPPYTLIEAAMALKAIIDGPHEWHIPLGMGPEVLMVCKAVEALEPQPVGAALEWRESRDVLDRPCWSTHIGTIRVDVETGGNGRLWLHSPLPKVGLEPLCGNDPVAAQSEAEARLRAFFAAGLAALTARAPSAGTGTTGGE